MLSNQEQLSSGEVRTTYISGNGFVNKAIEYTAVDGMAVFEGDIILGTVEEMEAIRRQVEEGGDDIIAEGVVITGQRFRWPNNTVPFTIAPELPNQERVTDAIQHWQDNTNLRFVARAQQDDFVTFRPAAGCSSSVGRVGGQQFINLADGCTTGSTIHEIGHCIGIWHEQSREDRDNFITIVLDNVTPANRHNFNQHITDGDDVCFYDYGSIMHYGRTAFAIDSSKPTILAPQPIGQRSSLSQLDIRTANFLYPLKRTMGDNSRNGPALTSRGNEVLLGWTGTGNTFLNFMTSSDGLNFGNKVTLGETSPAALALTVYQQRYIVAWIGSGNNRLNIMQSTDGRTWTDKVTLSDTSLSSPALAVFNDVLYIAWRGVGNNQLNVMRSTDGRNWRDKVTLSDTTTSGPALAAFDNRLHLAWRGVGNNRLNIMRSYNGRAFYNKVVLGETTESQPSLHVHRDLLYFGWQGVGNRRLNLLPSLDGLDWRGKLVSNETCIDSLAVTSLGNRLVRAWTGTDANHRLNSSWI